MEGQVFSHYRVLQPLGSGGMGVVYKALDTHLDRIVALKFLPPELTRDDSARQRFVQEAKAASALDHPNICTIHDIDTTPDGQVFMAMAFYEGETLKPRIERGPLPVEEALDIATQVAHGLAKAHGAGIVHRDIKPTNLMITKDGVVKILDFGIAKLMGQTGPTQTGTTIGTVAYMAPEQINGQEADVRADIWSLGVVLHEMLVGQLPFRGENHWAVMNAILTQAPAAISAQRADVPAEVEQIVGRALEKNREARYGSAGGLGADLAHCHAELATPVAAIAPAALGRFLKRPTVVAAAVLFLALIGSLAAWGFNRASNARWAREEAIPEIQRLADQDRFPSAFALAEEAARYLPSSDPILRELWPRISVRSSIVTLPPGADLYVKEYGADETTWKYLGQSPLQDVQLSRGVFEWRVQKNGFETLTLASPNPGVLLRNLSAYPSLTIELKEAGSVPPGMVPAPGGEYPVRIGGFNTRDLVPVGAFLVDRYEVTNKAFKEFVDQGGYQQTEYWTDLEFVDGGRALSWDQAKSLLRDATGRPGPATWELGDYPDGRDDYPVGGVSWYEALAYCRSTGKTLPTIFHWSRAAMSPGEHIAPLLPLLVPRSNFESAGPVVVGSLGGVGPYGTYDMGGNVREWAWNESEDHRRWILGGAWNEPIHMFTTRNSAPPFDRSPINGFRCALYEDGAGVPEALRGRIEVQRVDYRTAKSVSDEVFRLFKRRFSYDPIPLNARVEGVDDRTEDWVGEKVTLDAGYGGERVTTYLTLPKVGHPPYQVVVFFPGLGAFQNPGGTTQYAAFDFIVRSGRAFVQPVFKGSNERWDGFLGLQGEEYLRVLRERMLQWYQDLGRTLDYLDTRPEFDLGRVAFVGASFGASVAVPLLAVEPRLKAAVLVSGGFPYREFPAEADPVNYVSRVTIPVLMVSGRYDYVFPLEMAQRPLFDRFGTTPADKRHVILEAGHGQLPRGDLIRETLDWLDRYVGPVN